MKAMKQKGANVTPAQPDQSAAMNGSDYRSQSAKKKSTSCLRTVKKMLALGIISVFTAGICIARAKESNDYRATQENSSIGSEQQVKSKHGNTTMKNRRVRRGGRGNTHSIIFVGGKKTGSATKANPRQAKKVQGELNPQPIPPGKQRRPE